MSATNVSGARKTGYKFGNKAFKKAAAITMSKMGTRELIRAICPQAMHLSGTSVAIAADGIFNVVTLPDANAGSVYGTFRLPEEWVSTSDLTIDVYWKTTQNDNTKQLELVATISAQQSDETIATVDTLTTQQAPSTTANQVKKFTFSASLAANYAAGDLIGIKITRTPSDADDTLAADIKVIAIVARFTGRG